MFATLSLHIYMYSCISKTQRIGNLIINVFKMLISVSVFVGCLFRFYNKAKKKIRNSFLFIMATL